MIVRDIFLIQNFHILFNKRVVLFGAGRKGKESRELLENIGIIIDSFCDNNEKLWGTRIDDIDVLSASQMIERVGYSEDFVMLISMVHGYDNVVKQLEELGFTCPVFTLWGLDTALLMNINEKNT